MTIRRWFRRVAPTHVAEFKSIPRRVASPGERVDESNSDAKFHHRDRSWPLRLSFRLDER